jgi:hypothetical protein
MYLTNKVWRSNHESETPSIVTPERTLQVGQLDTR